MRRQGCAMRGSPCHGRINAPFVFLHSVMQVTTCGVLTAWSADLPSGSRDRRCGARGVGCLLRHSMRILSRAPGKQMENQRSTNCSDASKKTMNCAKDFEVRAFDQQSGGEN